MSDIRITVEGANVYTVTPYNADYTAAAKNLGGRWDGDRRAWRFAAKNEQHVRDLLTNCYGTTGDDAAEMVTVRVDVNKIWSDYPGREIEFAGRVIARRRYRDERVLLGDNVILVSGGFCRSGGSVKNPRIDQIDGGTVLEVSDVPRNHPDVTVDGATIVETATVDVNALQAERAKLAARIAEIDAILANQQ
jgi:hypothetical protein